MPAIYKSILDQIQADIQALALTDIDGANVQVVKVQADIEEILPGLPGVLIMPGGGETVIAGGGTNTRDDVAYPVAVGIFAADSDSQTANFDRNLLWREQIRRHFVGRRLDGVANVYGCLLEKRPAVDPFAWLTRTLWSSTLLLKFLSREERG